uniref:Uncharacterized protein n=1 Tax=Aegilops tauschii subsp. strangulata TaxID=200361 RepID=A0A453J4X4_AEGTS
MYIVFPVSIAPTLKDLQLKHFPLEFSNLSFLLIASLSFYFICMIILNYSYRKAHVLFCPLLMHVYLLPLLNAEFVAGAPVPSVSQTMSGTLTVPAKIYGISSVTNACYFC